MRRIDAPKSLSADVRAVDKARRAFEKEMPAVISREKNAASCNPGEAIWVLTMLLENIGSNPPQPEHPALMCQVMCHQRANASRDSSLFAPTMKLSKCWTGSQTISEFEGRIVCAGSGGQQSQHWVVSYSSLGFPGVHGTIPKAPQNGGFNVTTGQRYQAADGSWGPQDPVPDVPVAGSYVEPYGNLLPQGTAYYYGGPL